MVQMTKILLWFIFLFCFTFSGLVWTNPISHIDGRNSALTAPTTLPEDHKTETAQNKNAPRPAILFLMGTGLIGLIAIGRSKLFY